MKKERGCEETSWIYVSMCKDDIYTFEKGKESLYIC